MRSIIFYDYNPINLVLGKKVDHTPDKKKAIIKKINPNIVAINGKWQTCFDRSAMRGEDKPPVKEEIQDGWHYENPPATGLYLVQRLLKGIPDLSFSYASRYENGIWYYGYGSTTKKCMSQAMTTKMAAENQSTRWKPITNL